MNPLAADRARIAVLVMLTLGGLALNRRGRTGAAITLLAIGTLPIVAAAGYLEANPIDWR